MKNIKDIKWNDLLEEIDGVMFAVLIDIGKNIYIRKKKNLYFYGFKIGKKPYIRDIYDTNVSLLLACSHDQVVKYCAENKLQHLEVLTDVFVFDKTKHSLEYMLNMAKDKKLIFKPIFERESKVLDGRLVFIVKGE